MSRKISTLKIVPGRFVPVLLTGALLFGNAFANDIHVYPAASSGMPLSVIDRKTLKSRGYLTLADAIRDLSANPVAIDAYSSRDGTGHANLRGMGTRATRLLLNGEPLPFAPLDQVNGAAADLRLVPITAIERIEILPASNAVEDGSGAIGGSINIVMIENFNNVSGELWQTTTEDGAAETLLSFRNGRKINNRSYDYTIAWYHRDALMANQRDFSLTSDHRAHSGTDQRSMFSSPPTINNSLALLPQVADAACPPQRTVNNASGTSCVLDLNPFIDLAANDERINLGLGADWRFDNNIRFVLDLAFMDGKTSYRQSPAAIFGSTGPTQNIFYRPLDTGTAHAEVKDRVMHISGLASGKIKLWDWRAGLVYGRSTASRTEFNDIILNRFQDALLGNGGINGNRTYRPFGANPQHGTALVNFLTTDWNVFGDWKETRVFGETGSTLFNLPGGEARFDFGLEVATESLKQTPSQVAVDFGIAGSGPVIQVDAERQRSAVWATAEFPFHNRWSASVGLRSDDYDDSDGAASAQFGVVYQATDEVQFRTGYSQGFRSPTLAETNGRTAPGNRTLQANPGNPLLDPEESETVYFGVTWRSITLPGLLVSIDTWKTRQSGLIAPRTVVVAGNPTATLMNGGTLISQAADLNARYEVDLAAGEFVFGTQQTFVERLTNTQGVIKTDFSDTLPDYRSTYFVDWHRGRHGASANLLYASDYDTPGGTVNANGREMVDGWHTLGLQYRLQLDILKGSTFRVGCRNCTDEDPPFSNASPFGFESTYHDPRGLLVYASWDQVF